MGAAYRRVDRLFNRTLKKTGLSLAHVHLLACLLARGESRARDVARQTGFEPSTVSRLLLDLSRRKFVRRRPDPEDGRAVLFRTSPRGEGLRAEIERLARHADERLRRDVTEADLAGMFHAIEIMERLP
jgi:DNA-binding MarR family transcriptional regulator